MGKPGVATSDAVLVRFASRTLGEHMERVTSRVLEVSKGVPKARLPTHGSLPDSIQYTIFGKRSVSFYQLRSGKLISGCVAIESRTASVGSSQAIEKSQLLGPSCRRI